MGSLIEIKNLERVYEGKIPTPALRGISFEVRKGEFLAVMGKSGSGKSTLLHQLGLLDMPTKGEIRIAGVDVLGLTDHQKIHFRLERLGYIFQEYALLQELTALQNVALPAMAKKFNGENINKRATRLLSEVGLGERLDHYPNELSGGEQQRVAVARALINEPEILLADEPCANLDSVSSEGVLNLLSRLNKELGQTIIMVSHEEEDKKWTERVVWLKDGLVERFEKIKNFKSGRRDKKAAP